MEFIVVGISVSILNFMLVSYFLYKWFVTGEGGMK
jgi:hydrogenase-4 membrane subunit HyfE